MKPSYRYGFYMSAVIGPDSGFYCDTQGMYWGGSQNVRMGLISHLANFRDFNLGVGPGFKLKFNLALMVGF